MHQTAARLIFGLFVVLLATASMTDALGQVRPEARPPPLKKRPAKAETPAAVPAMEAVTYRPPRPMSAIAKKYHPPAGFLGHAWGDPRAAFARLPESPLSVRAAWTQGKQRDQEISCMGGVMGGGGALGDSCTYTYVINAMNTRREGGGFHVLSEYKIEAQGFQYGEVLLHPVIYQFCANWDSVKREVPEDFDQLNRLCGMRLLFASESLSQLRGLPSDHVTQYDLMLHQLMADYGKPSGFIRRGRVEIETMDDDDTATDKPDRKYSTWRWCPARDRGISVSCDASIVLSIDPESGRAIVLYATPALWQYAYARQNGHAKGDALFALMHAREPSKPATAAR